MAPHFDRVLLSVARSFPKMKALAIAGAVLCFGIRLIAIRRGWRLPVADLPQRLEAGAGGADDQQDKVGKL